MRNKEEASGIVSDPLWWSEVTLPIMVTLKDSPFFTNTALLPDMSISPAVALLSGIVVGQAAELHGLGPRALLAYRAVLS